jgi:hypothetical protein
MVAIGLVGAALPLVVPWIDTPNVLVWYALLGALVIVTPVRWRLVWVLLPLTLLANGMLVGRQGTSYEPAALLGLLALGSVLYPYNVAHLGDRLPPALGWVGRYPMSIYVGHLLLLEAVVAWFSIGVVR